MSSSEDRERGYILCGHCITFRSSLLVLVRELFCFLSYFESFDSMQYTLPQDKGQEETHTWRCFPCVVGWEFQRFLPLPRCWQLLPSSAHCWPWWTCRTVRPKYILGWKDFSNFQIQFHINQLLHWCFPRYSLPILRILGLKSVLEYTEFFCCCLDEEDIVPPSYSKEPSHQ